MADQTPVTDERGAWEDLGDALQRVPWLEAHHSLPFYLLSDDAFEICCFILLLREHPGERIYYYGKTGDKGRDIVHHHADGTIEFIQCKRYTRPLGVGEVRKELAKLCVNVFEKRLPVAPNRITFYVVPDLTSDSQDLLASQEEWKAAAPKALEEHLGKPPSAELLAFAEGWWPPLDRVTEVPLAERAMRQPELVERFFAVRKVITGSVTQLLPFFTTIQNELETLTAGINEALAPYRQAAAATTPQPPLTRAQDLVNRNQTRVWEERARRSLDSEGLKLWEEIRRDIQGLNNVRAIDAGGHMRTWLAGDGQHASPVVRGRVCILLSDLAVIESAIRSLEERIDLADARAWQAKALDQFGADHVPAEDAVRLVYLDARLTWLEGKAAEALDMLAAAEDPVCTSLRVAILLTQGADVEAAAVSRTLPPHDRWADRIVLAQVRVGALTEAEEVLRWAQSQSDPTVYQRCLVARAQGTFQRRFRERDRLTFFLDPLEAEDRAALDSILDGLAPILTPACARGQTTNGVEAEAMELAYVASRLSGDRERWRRYGDVLATVRPVSIEYARAVCRGDLDAPANLAERLRADYPQSFTADYVALVVEGIRGADFGAITTAVEALTPRADSEERKDQLAGLLAEHALKQEGEEPLQRAKGILSALVPADHPVTRAVEYERLRRTGQTAEAAALLAATKDKDDPLWLQLAASQEYGQGSKATALSHLTKAARLLGRTESYWQAFSLATAIADTEAMRALTRALIRLTPGDVNVHRNLAAIEFRAGRYREAAEAIAEVERLTPGTAEAGLFHAQALALSARQEEAVAILDRVCAAHPNHFPPFHLRAVLLDSLGRPVPAFDGLHAARDRFWGDMVFVHLYQVLAFRANREEDGHLAFLRLQELQNGDPNGPLRTGTLEDLQAMMRQERERHEHYNRELLLSRTPWLLVGHALGRESYIDWAIRTQEAVIPDAPIARAEYAVYATHGFVVRTDAAGHRSLERITAAPGEPVVADLSALLTLHRLGLLEMALSYFGRVVVPAGYVARFLDEHRSLQPHQASEIEARQAILAAVDQRRLRPAAADAGGAPYPVLEEHHLDEEQVDFHLIDALQWLQRHGRLIPDEVTRLQSICRRKAADAGAFQRAAPRGVRTDISTLTAVHKVGLLDRFVGSLRLLLEPREIEELRQSLLGVERREEITRWSRDLHALLAGDPRVETAEPIRPEELRDPDERDPVFDTVLLAEQRRLPLLADDRWLQALLLNARGGAAGAAFGTDHLLSVLASGGHITPAARATAWLQLAKWRYRFLLPTPSILLDLAARHPDFPPGDELRTVCRYLHECCTDPGLACGIEPTDPPTAVGFRYSHRIAEVTGSFLLQAWHDPRFEDGALGTLTRWCVQEFLPPPAPLPYAGSALAAKGMITLLLTGALGEACRHEDIARSNAALVAISEAAGVSADLYDDIMSAMVEVMADGALPDAPAESLAEIRRVTAAIAFYHLQGKQLGLRTASVLVEVGLIPPPAAPVDESAVAALEVPAHPRRIDNGPGPLIFLLPAAGGTAASYQYVPDLVYHPEARVRRAAVTFVTAAALPPWLAPGTRQTIEARTANLCVEQPTSSRQAARAIDDAIARDFFAALARFRQTRAAEVQTENDAALRRLLELDAETLGSILADRYTLPGDEWAGLFQSATEAAVLTAALDAYYDRYGHLPLAARYGMEAVVRGWANRHPTEDVWNTLWAWAGDASRPLKLYHVCRVFFRHPDLVPDAQRAGVWAAAADMLRGYGQEEELLARGETWHLLQTLARHYTQLLEVGSFDPNATAIAALAWWAAERVTADVVSTIVDEHGADDGAGIVRRIQSIVERLATRSGMSRQLVRPPRNPSAFGHGTLHTSIVWRASLLEAGPAAGLEIPEAHVHPFLVLILGLTGAGIPSRLGLLTPPVFAIETPFGEICLRWLRAFPEACRPEGLDEVNASDEAPDHQQAIARLRTIVEESADARNLLLSQLRAGVGLGLITPADLNWVLEERGWWDRVFDGLSDKELEGLSLILLDLLLRGPDEWLLGLPELFRQQASRTNLATERRNTAAGALLRSCLLTGRVGSLCLLMSDPESHALHDILRTWRSRLEGVRPIVPALGQARMRLILALLPPGEEPPPACTRTGVELAGVRGPE